MTDDDFAGFLGRMGGIVENPGQRVFENRDRLHESHSVFAQIQPSFVFVPFE
jgi:hypothetical protein